MRILTTHPRAAPPTIASPDGKDESPSEEPDAAQLRPVSRINTGNRITFAKDANEPPMSPRALYIPSPRDRDRGVYRTYAYQSSI